MLNDQMDKTDTDETGTPQNSGGSINNEERNINTGGGAYFEGAVHTNGGDVVNGPKNVTIINNPPPSPPPPDLTKYINHPLLKLLYEQELLLQDTQVGLLHLAEATGQTAREQLIKLEQELIELKQCGLVDIFTKSAGTRKFEYFSITKKGISLLNSRAGQQED